MKEDPPEDQNTQIILRPHHHPQPPYNGREDCWSEPATGTLIEAWGNRYLQLNRGNLRQKDWKEVADAVNNREDDIKHRKTYIQCKNRIDTVKKKYKIEKSKPGPSNWPFFNRLDHLIGTATVSNKKFVPTSSLHKGSGVTLTARPLREKINPNFSAGLFSGGSSSKWRSNSDGSTEISDDDDDEEDDDGMEFGGGKKYKVNEDSSDQAAFRELARAIMKFGEIYERIESSKQQQMMELERQKMELTKDLEFQRMQMFMDTQIELEKRKNPKNASTTGKKL